ncbi:RtcB family protein [Nocardioides sp. HM23]|uniref:RtcB family protein n=1 Tax=Nocardioides bizhenqiangii TaxID=3095076 RepID=UPI002AC9F97E|nr:RtcB family protein [Nocardioides sp. HM23]MDZ5622045.1 RtcB family protein [Nocardioides sp. HM23]
MGTCSFVVRGSASGASYCSASHGAGRRMSRAKAKRTFTLDELAAQTAGVECRKDAVIALAGRVARAARRGRIETGAYKDLEPVIEAKTDLVEVVSRLTTLMCVKG